MIMVLKLIILCTPNIITGISTQLNRGTGRTVRINSRTAVSAA